MFIVGIIIWNGKKDSNYPTQLLSTITAKVMTCQPYCLKTVPVHTTVREQPSSAMEIKGLD